MAVAYIYVRFSTDMQAEGSSEERQRPLAEEYARKHGLTLSPTVYRDEGVSAYRGKNFEKGALGRFISDVRKGVIPKGSYLLIDAFSRFSRQAPMKANALLYDLIQLGITIVTVENGQVFNAETVEQSSLGQSVETFLKMHLAHQESKDKSRMVKIGIDKKREAADREGCKYTAKCPSWLRPIYHPTKRKCVTHFELIPDKARVVKRIFELSFNGNGQNRIASVLNDDAVPLMSFDAAKHAAKNAGRKENGLDPLPTPIWTQSSVRNLLMNEAVFGRYRRKTGGDQVIDGYYEPHIIEQPFFDSVQVGLRLRDEGGGQRNDGRVANLFKSISYCAYCGNRMRFVPTKSAYLHCLTAYSGAHAVCQAPRFPYKAAEEAILYRLIHKQARDLSNDVFDDQAPLKSLLRAEIEALEARHAHALRIGLDLGTDSHRVAAELRHIQGQIETKQLLQPTLLSQKCFPIRR